MLDQLYKVILAWPLVVKRGLAHWRLLSAVIIGVLLASMVMTGTVIYFDSLRELALDNTLDKLSTTEKDIILKADRGPTTVDEFTKVERAVLPSARPCGLDAAGPRAGGAYIDLFPDSAGRRGGRGRR